MAKVMLVEDDNNLREIYGARLQAEGYVIISAQDGEEALALAVKEKPDLILSDVMMPRISGFDMLDILRNAPETRDTKIIMMTALSQLEDKARADKLGADKYLVKSQVTLEDVANTVREVLGGTAQPPQPEAPAVAEVPVPVVAEQPAQNIPAPAPTPEPATPAQQSTNNPEPIAVPTPALEPAVEQPAPQPAPVPAPEPAIPPVPAPVSEPAPEVVEPVLPEPIVAPQPEVAMPELATVAEPTQPTAPTEPTPQAPAPQAETPVAAPIKVELPTLPNDGTNEQAQSQTATDVPIVTPVVTAPIADDSTDTNPAVGPNLAEALAAEADDEPAGANIPNTQQFDASSPQQPVIANGASLPPIVEPQATSTVPTPEPVATEPPTEPALPSEPLPSEPETEDAPQTTNPEEPTHTESAVKDAGGVKRVIQPLTDMKGPDMNALLAAEEQKAAIANPVANTVITPTPQPEAGQTQDAPPLAKNDDVNNIAL
jgi:CheY-like chemotaxis protein